MNSTAESSLGEVWMLVKDHRQLQKLALIQGASQREIALAVYGNKAHSYVGRIMRGKVRTVSPEAAVAFALFFGVGVDDLFLPKSSRHPVRNSQSAAA